MLNHRKIFTCILLIAIITGTVRAADTSDPTELAGRVRALGNNYKALCDVSVIAQTAGGMEVFAISIGSDNRDTKPGIAILGGIDGRYIHSRELALGFAEELLRRSAEPEIKALLNEVSFYVFPDVSPDASAQYFLSPRYERNINALSSDNDRDFQTGEDPLEDLNGDGLITLIRIEDPSGNWLPSPDDARLMIKADPAKGQKGSYIVVSEGFDNDDDNLYNEDGEGGVSFNSNFSHNYEEFGLNSGAHALSETESRAVADFLFDHFNIYMTIAFGPQDNLLQPWKTSARPPQRGRKPDGVMKGDEAVGKLASDLWKKSSGMKGEPIVASTPGNFAEWAYYDYGRYSFSTPAWQISTAKGEEPAAALLKILPEENDVFIPWTTVTKGDFAGRKAEVGGLKPFATIVPPDSLTSSLKEASFSFITGLAEFHPDLQLTDLVTEKIEDNLWRVSVTVRNEGLFATCAEIGDRNKFVRRAQLTISPSKDQELLSGNIRQPLPRLEGSQTFEYSWLIMGKGDVSITAGAINCGTSTLNTELR